ncbi:response regulator [Streptomyces sp. NPDC007100]|uniref:response regulator n=1 Tax=Streptomyces sp. NPDC007100 TaxID=3155602 RepID=UPI0033EAB415
MGKAAARAKRGGAAGGERRTANTAGGGSSRGGIGAPGSRPGDAMDAKVADLFGAGRTPPPDTGRAADRGQPPTPLFSDPSEEYPDDGGATGGENDAARRRRRAQFLRDLNEAKELRDRVQPRRARAARMRQAMRMRTFRW